MLMQKPSKAEPRSTKRSSLRITLFIDVFTLLTITVIATAVGAFFLAQSELSVRTANELQQTVQARQEILETTIAKQREQISFIGQSNNPITPALQENIGFQEIFSLDTDGKRIETEATVENNSDHSETVAHLLLSKHSSSFFPIFQKNRWEAYAITAPRMRQGQRVGTIVAIFPARDLSSQIFSTRNDALSKDILLMLTDENGDLITLTTDTQATGVRVYVDPASKAGMFLQSARTAKEGYSQGVDYAGIKVMGAYKTTPSVGWTIMATVDQYTISSAMLRLAMNIVAIGLAFVGLLSLSTFVLARRITEPLEELSKKLNGLEARHWRYERSIYTGNELESVDEAGYELTNRLQSAHDHLEEIVRERTEELRKKLSENETILESIDYGIFVINEKGALIYTNKTGEKMVGGNRANDGGQSAIELLRLTDKDGNLVSAHDHPIRIVLDHGSTPNPAVDPEYSIRSAEDKDIPVHIRVTPILRGKRCIGVVAVVRDTTEERRIDKIKSEFISLVSHQLRTPLSSMRWYLEMLSTKDAGPLTLDQEEYVREASTSNARMVHLVNGLLNVSRLEMGKMETKTEPLDVEKIVKETADTFALELKQKDLALEISSSSIKDLSVTTDRGLLQLIIENFLSNAIKYSKEKTTIALKIVGDPMQKIMTISVADTGIGIPVEQREFIGRRLFRGTNARLENTDGNGLGLYISTIAAEAIGATLTFSSQENQGSTFILRLPAIISSQASLSSPTLSK